MIPLTQERRANPRIEINGELSYRAEDWGESGRGILDNLSLQGAGIWIEEALPLSSRLRFRVESEVEQFSFEFVATLLRSLPGEKQSLYGYGCTIEQTGKHRR